MKKYLNIIMGCFLIALAFNLFIIPYDLVPNGIYGLGALIYYNFDYSAPIFLLIINLALIGIATLSLGAENTRKYMIPSLLIPIIIYFTQNIAEQINIYNMDKTIITITAGVITGLGHSLIFKEGYSTGGLFLLQDIFNSVKIYRRKTFTYIFETIIIILTGFVVNFETSLYSAVLIVIINYMATMSRVGASTSKTFFIITTEETSVKDYILNELHYDLTEINVKGGFTSHKNKIIMATIEEMSKEVEITSVTREDLESRGFDTTNITDEQMKELARKMCDDYLEQMFWISLDIIAEDIMGFKKK